MKNQFVGDVNDYYKYGLLRILSGFGKKKIGICWMLTPDGTEYMKDKAGWRSFDPELFDKLNQVIRNKTVKGIEKGRILPRALYYDRPFKSGSRQEYFEEALRELADADLIFFDPDVGLAPSPSRRGAKWLHLSELKKAFDMGHSVLVIQFPRRKTGWDHELASQIQEEVPAGRICTFVTRRNRAFFLVAQEKHANFFRRQAELVKKQWAGKITVIRYPDIEESHS